VRLLGMFFLGLGLLVTQAQAGAKFCYGKVKNLQQTDVHLDECHKAILNGKVISMSDVPGAGSQVVLFLHEGYVYKTYVRSWKSTCDSKRSFTIEKCG
jgi:hypothetical protein